MYESRAFCAYLREDDTLHKADRLIRHGHHRPLNTNTQYTHGQTSLQIGEILVSSSPCF